MQILQRINTRNLGIILSSTLLGFISISSQILLSREVISSFYGNEISIGIMFFSWLLWVGLGSLIGNIFIYNIKRLTLSLFISYLFLAFILFATIILIRIWKLFFGFLPGEIVGLWYILFLNLIIFAPFCFLLGFIFLLNSRILSDKGGVNLVYLLEGIGAFIGGVITTYILIPNLSNFMVFEAIMVSIIITAIIIKPKYSIAGIILIILIIIKGGDVEKISLNLKWSGLNLLSSSDSVYGNITVTKEKEQIGFYENSLIIFSYPNKQSMEEGIHYALLEHPNPKSILLIGGGVSGIIKEALKYKDLRIDYVELDPLIIRTAERYLPEEIRKSINSDRVNIYFMDGRLYIKETKRLYDLIVVNMPEPFTAQINRFYTYEFFKEAKRLLNPYGIISFRVRSQENYISPELQRFLSSIYFTLNSVFKEVVVFPGFTNIFFASDYKGILTDNADIIVKRVKERGLKNQFVNEYLIPYRLFPYKIEYLKNSILSKSSRTNYDLYPISYFYDTILWSSHFHSGERALFLFLSDNIWIFLLPIPLILFPLLLKKRAFPLSLLTIIFVTGFSNICIEIICIILFQIFYGYIYSKIGIILTSFMVGLAIGAWIPQKFRGKEIKWIRTLEVLIIFLTLMILISLRIFSKISTHFSILEISFIIMMISIGIVGGFQFIMVNKVYKGSMGKVYAIDLIGSSLGALLCSTLLIPLMGIPKILLIIALMNLMALFTLLRKFG